MVSERSLDEAQRNPGLIPGVVNYRRARLPGATYFFTVTLGDRRSRVLTEHVDVLRDVVRCVKRQWPFRIDALVMLPDHLPAVWTLPEGDADFSKRWQAIKTQFTRRLVKRAGYCPGP